MESSISWIVYSLCMIFYILSLNIHKYKVSKVNIKNILPKVSTTKNGKVTNINIGKLTLIEAEAVMKYYKNKKYK